MAEQSRHVTTGPRREEISTEARDEILSAFPEPAGNATEQTRLRLMRWSAVRGAEMAQPHIARSAQVAILRKLADEDDAEIAHLTMREGNTVVGSQAARDIAVRISAAHKSKARFERKLAELEAGA